MSTELSVFGAILSRGFKVRCAHWHSEDLASCYIKFDSPDEDARAAGERLHKIIYRVAAFVILSSVGLAFYAGTWFAQSPPQPAFAYRQPFASIVLPDGTLSVITSQHTSLQPNDQITHVGNCRLELIPDAVPRIRAVERPHSLLRFKRGEVVLESLVENRVAPTTHPQVKPTLYAMTQEDRHQLARSRTRLEARVQEEERLVGVRKQNIQSQRDRLTDIINRREAASPNGQPLR